MCFRAIIAINKYKGSDLTPTQLAVLKEIASYYNKELSNPLYPSIKALCLKTRFGHAAIERALKHLRDNHFLTVILPADKGRKRPTFYAVNFEKLSSDENYNVVDKIEDKAVDKVTTSLPSRGLHPSLSLTNIVSSSLPRRDDHRSCKTININIHDNGDYKKLLFTMPPNEILEKFGVDKRSISRWIVELGNDRICHEISSMSEITYKIGNPGAWLRRKLDGGHSDMGLHQNVA